MKNETIDLAEWSIKTALSAGADACSIRSSRLDFNTRLACAGDRCGPRPFPLGVGFLAASLLGAALVSLEDPLLADTDVLFDLKRQYIRVPPGYRMSTYLRPVEARPYASAVRANSLRTTVDNALLAEAGRSWDRLGLSISLVGRVERRIEDLQPAR